MKAGAIVDTGPLVAFLNRRDAHHDWARDTLARISPPLLTCEAVLSEVLFLLRALPGGSDAVFKLLREELVRLDFSLAEEHGRVAKLLAKYRDVPMSLADGCLVRMSELHPGLEVLTHDSDVRRYRRNGREVIPVLMP